MLLRAWALTYLCIGLRQSLRRGSVKCPTPFLCPIIKVLEVEIVVESVIISKKNGVCEIPIT